MRAYFRASGHGPITPGQAHSHCVDNPVDNQGLFGDRRLPAPDVHNRRAGSPRRSIGCPRRRHAGWPATTGVDPHCPQDLLLLLQLVLLELCFSITVGMNGLRGGPVRQATATADVRGTHGVREPGTPTPGKTTAGFGRTVGRPVAIELPASSVSAPAARPQFPTSPSPSFI